MARLRIEEAIAIWSGKDKKIYGINDLAKAIFPEKGLQHGRQMVKWYNEGRTDKISIEKMKKICNLTGVTADYLIGID